MSDKIDLIRNTDDESIADMDMGLLISSAFYSFTQHMNDYFDEIGLSLTQARVLFTLGIRDNVSIDYIADKTYTNKSIVTNSVKVLEKKDLVKKEIDSSDNRKKIITITNKGIQVRDKSQEISLKIEDEMVDKFGSEELASFKKYLKKFILILNEWYESDIS